MIINQIHPWNISPKEAVDVQKTLADKVILRPPRKKIRHIAGADISYDRKSDTLFSAVIVFEFPSLLVIEKRHHQSKPQFPYIPGLLSFREIPPLVECFKKVSHTPDVLICDGHGIAHPRKFGLASHLGLLLRIPSIGCAKKILVGEGDEPEKARGSISVLRHAGNNLGCIVRTRDNVKPVFVSPGHLTDTEHAVSIVLTCCTGYRLPEPTRQAHCEVNAKRVLFLEKHTEESD